MSRRGLALMFLGLSVVGMSVGPKDRVPVFVRGEATADAFTGPSRIAVIP